MILSLQSTDDSETDDNNGKKKKKVSKRERVVSLVIPKQESRPRIRTQEIPLPQVASRFIGSHNVLLGKTPKSIKR